MPADWKLVEQKSAIDSITNRGGSFAVGFRRKYVGHGDLSTPPVIAPQPPSLEERCFAAPGMPAAIIVEEHSDHLLLYRREAIFAGRHGSADLLLEYGQVHGGLSADWLKPICELIRTRIRGDGCLQLDETPVRYRDQR